MKRANRNRQCKSPSRRSGLAATEFAVCLPLILVLLVGTLKASTMIFLKQSLTVAAYEGARTAIISGAVTSDVNDACNGILTQRRVNGGSVSVSPGPLESQPTSTWITVTVSAPASSNSVIQGFFYSSHTVAARATMMKEYD